MYQGNTHSKQEKSTSTTPESPLLPLCSQQLHPPTSGSHWFLASQKWECVYIHTHTHTHTHTHIVYSLVTLVWHTICKIHLCCIYWHFIHFYCWVVLHYINNTHVICLFILLFMEIAMVSKIWLLWISRQWIPVYRSLWGHVFIWKSDLRGESKACSHGECMFNFMRSCQTAFQRGGFMLHSLQHYVRIPAVLHACQHLVWSLFNICCSCRSQKTTFGCES